jgi:hypothetical protein
MSGLRAQGAAIRLSQHLEARPKKSQKKEGTCPVAPSRSQARFQSKRRAETLRARKGCQIGARPLNLERESLPNVKSTGKDPEAIRVTRSRAEVHLWETSVLRTTRTLE